MGMSQSRWHSALPQRGSANFLKLVADSGVARHLPPPAVREYMHILLCRGGLSITIIEWALERWFETVAAGWKRRQSSL